MRFPLIRSFLPQLAFGALSDRISRWWDEWVFVWGAMFIPEERARWKGAERGDLDADMIDHGWHGGFAATSGGDEG